MSISISIPTPPSDPFTGLPDEVNEHLLGFLANDPSTIARMTNASSSLRTSPFFNEHRLNASRRLLNEQLAPYTPELQRLFEEQHVPILRLPFLSANRLLIVNMPFQEMPSPIMRFRDIENRTGIVFHVIDQEIPRSFVFSISRSAGDNIMRFTMHRNELVGRIGPPPRYPLREENLFQQFIEDGSPINYEVISDLLMGKHEFLRIAPPYAPRVQPKFLKCCCEVLLIAGITASCALLFFGITRLT